MKHNLPIETRYMIWARDSRACQARRLALHLLQDGGPATGLPTDYCNARRDIHHILPVRLGGTDEPDNLVVLCGVHHRHAHDVIRRGFTYLPHYLAARAEKARDEAEVA